MSRPTRLDFVREDPPARGPERCAVCRARLVPPPAPRGGSLLVCVVCWFDGDGKRFWEEHRRGEGSLVVCHRADGGLPERPDPRVTSTDFTFVAEEDP